MRNFVLILVAAILCISAGSCRKDFDFEPSEGNLEFSKDTVFLDTIFTNIGSATYTLKVYNRSNKDVQLPFVGLEGGEESDYRINVDGLSGKTFSDIPLLAKDSLFVFIETTFDISSVGENEFLYTDALLFGAGDQQQRVELVTLVRDAIFLYPRTLSDGTKETLLLGLDEEGDEIRIEGFFLEDDELRFTDEKPYVIYGYAAVDEGNTLTVDAGARVHFHQNSGILVTSGASIQINGALSEDGELLENEVIFEGDRLEPGYADLSGQWGTIWLAEGSISNHIEYLTLKNATVGLLVEGNAESSEAKLILKSTQIFNSSSINLWARNSYINAENLVLGNAGQSALYCSLGGRYDFAHATIANYWNTGFRNSPAVLIDNFEETPTQTLGGDLNSTKFSNCIIDGNRDIELLLNRDDRYGFEFAFENCLIKFNDVNEIYTNNPLFNFEDTSNYRDILLNGNTLFVGPNENDFRITVDSGAIDFGDANTALLVPFDIMGNDRTPTPDAGAYEYVLGQ
ncbi:hypothetical protein [Allomuricauda sp. SCSIO 65647]|uniref:hypothetical protein n=1 Tax=Allomuricauda sp. SCSIO 65647 TaxID=2908843 RepID=UPI001F43725A|nr:hypothetical protein [Muricauda sp. SCSIO 65647]UJH67566.1 hypothetical protein L0P89_16660 [Muricauda sp. SCSIO 65647]